MQDIDAHWCCCVPQVRDTAVSRNAYRLARQFIKLPGDQLILMTCVGPSADTQRPTAMLNSFTDVMTDAQTRRQVIIQVRVCVAELLLCTATGIATTAHFVSHVNSIARYHANDRVGDCLSCT